MAVSVHRSRKDNFQQKIIAAVAYIRCATASGIHVIYDPVKWKLYVVHQVEKVHEEPLSKDWCYVATDQNPADCASRGVEGAKLRTNIVNAVRAAVEGRVLVLEGIEKAERNVLPVLNNLLENREMHLEDGRFLIPASRYDKLLKEHTKEELDKWKLVRVSDDFRVIALGLPVPKYTGNPLDPPLRSRFQARSISHSTFQVCA
ncbi:hypothetical protein RUM44_006107 [Polyplax serrata]|uniref:ATPase dynein-related AAA domain-containing protein n=1 Tax=Polyplax serrata TaxID=468196 RepID=A0ABR1AYZ5_POLSC